MTRRTSLIVAFFAFLGGCKNSATKTIDSAVNSPARVAAAPVLVRYDDVPMIEAGITVDQAYAAIPHRRTVWIESDSAVPSEDKPYLKAIFQVLDQAVAVRVASLQNYSSQRFDASDTDGELKKLIDFVNAMPVPKTLTTYHAEILAGLTGERQFFQDWRRERDQFGYAQQIANHPGVRSCSAALRAAYSELMAKYPTENSRNKDAFFDYHCALDFL